MSAGPAMTALRLVIARTAAVIRCAGIAYVAVQVIIGHAFDAADSVVASNAFWLVIACDGMPIASRGVTVDRSSFDDLSQLRWERGNSES